jgi:hypothetical protein
MAYAVAALAVLATAYIGSYYTLVDRGRGTELYRRFIDREQVFVSHPAQYRIFDTWAQAAFAPWHHIDRNLRPNYWTEYVDGEWRPLCGTR